MIAAVVNAKLATLHELKTCYGAKALYDLWEIGLVDAENKKRYEEAIKKK